jgi:hypothetical protein
VIPPALERRRLKGVITPGAVQLLEFGSKNGFFTYPQMGSKCVAAAHRTLRPGERFTADSAAGGEAFLFVWKGGITVDWQSRPYRAGERETVFIRGEARPEVRNDSGQEAIVIEVQAYAAPRGY